MTKSINVNMRHLRVLIEVGRRSSFRAAAAASHLGQPAASQAISRLEQALNAKLLDRATRPVRLTPAGEMFLADAERVLADFDRSVDQLGAFVSQGTRRVRVACLSSAVFRLLPAVLKKMEAEYPQLSVVVEDDNVRGIRRRLESGQCDVGIASDEVITDSITFEAVLDDPFHVLCPRGHVLWGRGPIDLAALDGQPLILLQKDSGIRLVLERACAEARVKLVVSHETQQIHTLMGMVDAGMGAAVMPALACTTTPGRVEARLIRNPALKRQIGVCHPSEREPSAGARLFAAMFRSLVAPVKD